MAWRSGCEARRPGGAEWSCAASPTESGEGRAGRLRAGALEEREYRDKSPRGFEGIGLEPTRVYQVEEARDFLTGAGLDVDTIAPQVGDKFMSAFVRAHKPA